MIELFEKARSVLPKPRSVIDIGPGIRPQEFFPDAEYTAIEPHDEYVHHLRAQGRNVLHGTALMMLPMCKHVDMIFMLDSLEHMTPEEGRNVLELCRKKADTTVVFTPLGFLPQSYVAGQKDAWGMNGTHWQTHRSGWTPEDFQGWDTLIDPGFMSGAFFAIGRHAA